MILTTSRPRTVGDGLRELAPRHPPYAGKGRTPSPTVRGRRIGVGLTSNPTPSVCFPTRETSLSFPLVPPLPCLVTLRTLEHVGTTRIYATHVRHIRLTDTRLSHQPSHHRASEAAVRGREFHQRTSQGRHDRNDWESLAQLQTRHDFTPLQFTGDTAAAKAYSDAQVPLADIFSVLQALINLDTLHSYFLNGDMAFLNAVLGLKSASSHHPCPICVVPKADLLAYPQPHRDHHHRVIGSYSRSREALLVIPSDRIVPLPLHIFLGISNKLVGEVFPALLGEEALSSAWRSVKSIHSHGSSGAAAVHDLNGAELTNWLKQHRWKQITHNRSTLASADIPLMDDWMRGLQSHLLHKRDWSDAEQASFSQLVQEMQQFWVSITNTRVFPKLHMLTHASEFARRYNALGRYAESHIEAYHAHFNRLYTGTHYNQGSKTAERIRRCLADLSVAAAVKTRPSS